MKKMAWLLAGGLLFACHSSAPPPRRLAPPPPAQSTEPQGDPRAARSTPGAPTQGDPSCGEQPQICVFPNDQPEQGATEQAVAILIGELLKHWGGGEGLPFAKYLQAAQRLPVRLTAPGLQRLEASVEARGEQKVVTGHLQGMLKDLQALDSDGQAALTTWAQRFASAPPGLRVASLGVGGAGPFSGVYAVGCRDPSAGCRQQHVRALLQKAFRWAPQTGPGPRSEGSERENRFIHIEGVRPQGHIGEVRFEALRAGLEAAQGELSALFGSRWRDQITLFVVVRGSHQVEMCNQVDATGVSYCSQDALWVGSAPGGIGPNPSPTPKGGAAADQGPASAQALDPPIDECAIITCINWCYCSERRGSSRNYVHAVRSGADIATPSRRCEACALASEVAQRPTLQGLNTGVFVADEGRPNLFRCNFDHSLSACDDPKSPACTSLRQACELAQPQ